MRWCFRSLRSTMRHSPVTYARAEIDITVSLDHRTQSAIRRLLMAEPEPGAMLPPDAIEAAAQLVGADNFGVCEADDTGCRRPQRSGSLGRRTRRPATDRCRQGSCTTPPSPTRTGWHQTSVCATACGRGGPPARDGRPALLRPSSALLQRARHCRAHDGGASHQAVDPQLYKATVVGLAVAVGAQVLSLVASGASNREVAEELVVTVHTVRKHLETPTGSLESPIARPPRSPCADLLSSEIRRLANVGGRGPLEP